MTRHIAVNVWWIVLLLAAGGCAKDQSGPVAANATPVAELTGYEGCFPFDGIVEAEDCLELRVDRGTLYIRHLWAAFNCCPGEISADIEVAPLEIIIRENESESACRCLCLYTVHYKITNLTPGTYTIRIVEPYVTEEDDPLVCAVDVATSPQKRCCVVRTTYPWN